MDDERSGAHWGICEEEEEDLIGEGWEILGKLTRN